MRSVIAASHNVSHMSAVTVTVVTPAILWESGTMRVSCGHYSLRSLFVVRAGEDGNTSQQSGQHYRYEGSFHLHVSL